MKRLSSCLLVLVLLSPCCFAAPEDKALDVIVHTVDSVIAILEREHLTLEQKRQQVIDTVSPVFDFELMGKLVLGRQHWASLDKAQQNTYIDLFVKTLHATYVDKIELFSGQTIQYEKPTVAGSKVHIETKLVDSGEAVSIVYKMYRTKDTWRAYDIEIQGVSIVKSYGSQYSEVLSEGTPEDLLTRMREKLSDLSSSE